MRMGVLCETISRGKGGMERIAANLASHLAARGHEAHLLFKGPEPVPAYPVEPSVRPMMVERQPDASLVRALAGEMARARLDAVYVFYPNHRLAIYLAAARLAGCPAVVQECTNPERAIHTNWRSGRQPAELSTVEREALLAQAHRVRFVLPPYVASVPPVVRATAAGFANAVAAAPRPARFHDDGAPWTSIVVMGGTKANKNCVVFLEAFAAVAGEFPEWRVVLTGAPPTTPNEYYSTLEALARRDALSGRVELTGAVADVDSVYEASSLHVIASLSEGCPTCVLEAMAHGVPTLALAESTGTNQLVRDGETGVLARGVTMREAFEDGLRRLLPDRERLRRFGRAAYEEARGMRPEEVYDRMEGLMIEAAGYRGDPGRLAREREAVDKAHARHLWRVGDALLRPYTLGAGAA